MFRTDNSTSIGILPTIPAVGTPAFFTNGNPVSGVPATVVDDWWMNMMQEEIMTVIVQSGLTPAKTDFTQLWQALQRLYPRLALRANLTLYVDPVNGNDARDGLTPGTAYRTIQYATNRILFKADLNGFTVTIKLMPGIHQPFSHIGSPSGQLGSGNFIYEGDVNTPGNVIISGAPPPGNGCAVFVGGAQAHIRGVKFQMLTGSDYACGSVYAVQSAVFPYFCDFGDMGVGTHITANYGSLVGVWGPYTISGGAANHWDAGEGVIFCPGRLDGGFTGAPFAVTVLNNPTFSNAFARAQIGAKIQTSAALTGFSGGAQGTKFLCGSQSFINVFGRGVGFFPGTVAGTVDPVSFGLYG